MKYAKDVTELIGNTPLIKLKIANEYAMILGKCEFMNPTHSVKDRIGKNMIETALKEGLINENSTIIEPTSGNTGIALASVCASLGLKLILTMPDSMSMERRTLLKALGAKLVLTDSNEGMLGAVRKAKELSAATNNSFILQQFSNPSNPDVHRKTTALEILKDTEGKIDILIAGVGTGGTITGIGEILKAHNPDIEIIAVEPLNSQVLCGKEAGAHEIQGIGAGFVPDVLNTKIYGEIIAVSNEDAINTSRYLAKEEGLLVGISSGANVFAATKVAKRPNNRFKTIVTILCDTAERYLSCGLYESEG
ncbi:MAG: cysteine synthase A [Sulfurimonas sp. RIFOXYD12_FULL_33_39]|uniref:cysteine synthase A n=1 Tax=unclassified Sulfurimonas TaxID=2623549 RepID=UPI0008D1529D|nr:MULTISPECIES: cysteine synthase A [unclassified Sulfurimonas]OHE07702.1 MAG: cysteine synthase A [Sulfurimonas sp. RIFCSPLOWO2_12_FULL_34_6]OHE10733.1 MAG: cysteine synthase A [Sulfurimonas sp. RIFOXYD12_FULL_33_39]OHE13497.1 MAG: cysteine synthase A [Sulfurimonas sp. RIFOXYD2_FULL_34_21]